MDKEAIIKEYQRKVASKGGRAMVEKYGKKFLSEMGKKGSSVRWARERAKKKIQEDGNK